MSGDDPDIKTEEVFPMATIQIPAVVKVDWRAARGAGQADLTPDQWAAFENDWEATFYVRGGHQVRTDLMAALPQDFLDRLEK